MKFRFTALILLLVLAFSCQKPADSNHGHEHNDEMENGGNQALYEDVMKVHDEVMPKMDDLYKAKVALQTQLKTNPTMPEIEKKQIQAKISRLDSASESMMVWMREFNPIADSAGEEKARRYLENEMIRVKNVKENILSALQAADTKN